MMQLALRDETTRLGGGALALSLLAVMAAVAGRMVTVPLTASGFRAAAIATGLAALVLALQGMARRVCRAQTEARLAEVIEHEARPAFVTDTDGAVRGANRMGRERCGARPGRTLAEAMADRLASPGAALTRLQREAAAEGRAAAEVGGRDGPATVAVRRAGRDHFLWHLDERRAEARNDGAFDDLPVALVTLDTDGRIVSANGAARALLGVSDPAGSDLRDLLGGLGRPLGDWLREASAGDGDAAVQFLQGLGPAAGKAVQASLKPGSGPTRGRLLAVLNDVTAFKSLEAQFFQSQKMQAVGQLAGGVAHDFNNLLTAIQGHCDLLCARRDQGDPDYADLMQITDNVNRAAALVSQLLAFSRKQSLRLEPVDLRDTLSGMAHLLNRLVGEKVRLVFDQGPDLPPIRADRRQLEQVVMNLVVNARDAMPEGGEIHVAARPVQFDAPYARDRARVPAGRYVTIEIRDEGEGIPPEAMPKIFDPFYTTKPAGEGTGLGLSTAYGIVKQSGGFIFADSTPGDGTCFTLFFPATGGGQGQASPAVASGGEIFAPRRGGGPARPVPGQVPARRDGAERTAAGSDAPGPVRRPVASHAGQDGVKPAAERSPRQAPGRPPGPAPAAAQQGHAPAEEPPAEPASAEGASECGAAPRVPPPGRAERREADAAPRVPPPGRAERREVDAAPGVTPPGRAERRDADVAPAAALPPPSPSRPLRVLLVEDEASVRAFAARALTLHGHHVLEAECGETALELLAGSDADVDVIVTDVVMPGRDGPSWVREALVERPGMRVIFMSGYAEEDLDRSREALPGSLFLSKPFSLAALVETVREAVA